MRKRVMVSDPAAGGSDVEPRWTRRLKVPVGRAHSQSSCRWYARRNFTHEVNFPEKVPLGIQVPDPGCPARPLTEVSNTH